MAWLATIALAVFSYASFDAAHQANVNTATEQRQHGAESVSFSENGNGNINSFDDTVIADNSNASVYNVVIRVEVALFNHIPSGAPVIKTLIFFVQDIPACSVGTASFKRTAVQQISKLVDSFRYITAEVGPMSFTDRYGVSWIYSTSGGLKQGSGLSRSSGTIGISVPFKPSTGCS